MLSSKETWPTIRIHNFLSYEPSQQGQTSGTLACHFTLSVAEYNLSSDTHLKFDTDKSGLHYQEPIYRYWHFGPVLATTGNQGAPFTSLPHGEGAVTWCYPQHHVSTHLSVRLPSLWCLLQFQLGPHCRKKNEQQSRLDQILTRQTSVTTSLSPLRSLWTRLLPSLDQNFSSGPPTDESPSVAKLTIIFGLL